MLRHEASTWSRTLNDLAARQADAAMDVNPLYIQWKNPEFLAFLGAQKGGAAAAGVSVLDEANVMEYFSTSPFYDRHSNNEHVRMPVSYTHLRAHETDS